MTAKTRAQINAYADVALADNTTRDIDEEDVRQAVKDLADSAVFPEDGYLNRVNHTGTQTLSTISDAGDLASGDDASDVPFDPIGTGLSATDVQAAIEEVAAGGSGTSGEPFVILVSGQSNVEITPAFSWSPPANLTIWDWAYRDDTDTGSAFLAVDNTKINTAWRFAAEVALANPAREVRLIYLTYGGVAIAKWIGGTSPNMWQVIDNNVPAALAVLGVSKIDMFVWWQGESDAIGGLTSTYAANFATLMAQFYGETWFPRETPIVICSIGTDANTGGTGRDEFNVVLRGLVHADEAFRTLASTDGLDNAHWSGNDLVAVGCNVAGKVIYDNYFGRTGKRTRPKITTIDVTGNPNYPYANKGDTYAVSGVGSGKIGGASGAVADPGDVFICLVDGSASGNHATVGTNWVGLNGNFAILSYATLTGSETLTNKTLTSPVINGTETGTAVRSAAMGGTGQLSYAIGDILYASSGTALAKLADVATGNALISGGVTTAPSWGKVTTSHMSGTANRLFGTDGSGNGANVTLPAAGLTISSSALSFANDLAALEGLSSTGFAARTTTDTWAQRSLSAPAAGFTITNPAGVAGDPTFVLANDLAALEALSGTNTIYYRSGTDAWSAVTVGATLSFSAGTLGIASSAALPGSPTTTTQSAGTNNTTVATTAFAMTARHIATTLDCSGNPNYPAANRGDSYKVTVAGKIGGTSGPVVEVGDVAICFADAVSTGDHATVGTSWGVVQNNLALPLAYQYGGTGVALGAIIVIGYAIAINANSVADTAVTVSLPGGVSNYRINNIIIQNTGTTASLTTAHLAIYSAAAAGGTAVLSDIALSTLTSNAVNGATNSKVVGATEGIFNFATLYVRITTAQGAAATINVYITAMPAPSA